jgi:hypothetical protein
MQLIVFMPMLIFLAFFGLLVGGFLLLILKIVNQTKNSYWKGNVTDKLYNAVEEDSDNNSKTPFYTIVVKTGEGLTRKIAVRKEMYDSVKVGDVLEKPKGKLNPVKV